MHNCASKEAVIGKKERQRLTCRGKRSAVVVVNDSPVDCQSRARARLSELSAKLTEWFSECFSFLPFAKKRKLR